MKYADLISKMTLEEKCTLLSGKNTWETRDFPHHHIPSIWLSDGPNGLRKQLGAADHLGLNASQAATCFPTSATVANSWDESLAEDVGKALGEEAAAQGIHVLLGPGLNIKRNPLCGRNFEYFSEDPYLSGKMAAAYIRGIQEKGGSACPKHFAVNSQETRRMAGNSVVDERTLREIYLTGFEIAVKEGHPKAIMTAYNQVNGTYANENGHLLKEILREEWGFDGAVITDWGGGNDVVEGAKNGSNLEMPGAGLGSARELLKGVKDGRITEAEIDERVDELLGLIFSTYEKVTVVSGELKVQTSEKTAVTAQAGGQTAAKERQAERDDCNGQGNACADDMYTAHHAVAKRAAAESVVLLKNEEHILPLKAGTKVAVLGDFAFKPRFQGAGSSEVNAVTVEDTFKALEQEGLLLTAKCTAFSRDGSENQTLEQEAVAAAKHAETVLFYMGLDEISESEGRDRDHMKLHENQVRVLKAVAAVNPNVVVILSAGSPVEMPWVQHAKALLHGYLGGEASAAAMAEVITGKVNPCGKLAETLPLSYENVPCHQDYPAQEWNSCYREGLYVGYRYYDTAKVPVRFPFGYGLSYTTFAYSDIHMEDNSNPDITKVCDRINMDGEPRKAGLTGRSVSFTLTNTGDCPGSEIAQLYISKPDSEIFHPQKELKGFAKTYLQPGESKCVTIPLDDKAFRYFNTATGKWEIEGGTYLLTVAASVAEPKLEAVIEVNGTGAPNPYARIQLPSCYRTGKVQAVNDRDFETLLGHPVPQLPKSIHRNSAIRDLKHGRAPLGWIACRVLASMEKKSVENGTPDLNLDFIYNIPLRGIAKYIDLIDMAVVDGLVMEARGFWIIGLLRALAALIHNQAANAALAKTLKKQAKRAAALPKESGKATEYENYVNM
ncbi:MAG: glycoside hydrolase family 3 C-terminal domain-containing protein [Lachnospiraceae bacterium]|nr:glycoside hydrolase family 3 C-terminal domain-containing protein [Lachnospiraceae bacterium]